MIKKNTLRSLCALLVIAVLISALAACGATVGSDVPETTAPPAQSDHADEGASPSPETEDNDRVNISDVPTITSTVSKDPKFDVPVLTYSEEDFAKAGFSLGDSCDVVFSNGYALTDVPYFSGYYVKTDEPVIVAYPHNPYVLIARNNTALWTPAELDDTCTVTITLNTAGKYLSTQEALSQSYSVDRADYTSDEEFANFRALSGGNMKENFLYRGASPVDNSRNRASTVDSLLKDKGIECVIDLADSAEDMEGYFAAENFASDYTKSLYESGRVIVLSMSSSYGSDAYKASVGQGMRHLLKNGGPAYLHCMEGKDRTGFVCLLLEALVGASYDEMRDDYMETYANYFKMTEDGEPERYKAVVELYFDGFLEYLCGGDTDTLKTADYTGCAKEYLTECGLTEEEIDELIDLISA